MAKRDAKGRFVKGQSGNPLGRAKRKTELEYLEALGKRVSLKDWLAIVDKAVALAKDEGDFRARQWLSDYLMGKAVQMFELMGRVEAVIATDDVSGLTDEELESRIDKLFTEAEAGAGGGSVGGEAPAAGPEGH